MVITGGMSMEYKILSRVQGYNNRGGQTKQLPDLLTPRLDHACGSYYDSSNNLVSNRQCNALPLWKTASESVKKDLILIYIELLILFLRCC